MIESPQYIKALLRPNGNKPAGRRIWSIDLEQVWLPFFTATNTMGDTAIPHDALGAPLRLAYDSDGSVKFSKTGRPVVKVAKEIADSVKGVRENFVAGLMAYANGIITECPEGYKAQVEASIKAGKPIVEADNLALENALAALAKAQADAEAQKAMPKAEQPKPKAKTKAKAKPEGEAVAEAAAIVEAEVKAEPELVAV